MASSYPGAVDALVRPDGTDPLSDGHAALHNATSDAVEAVQTELGVNPAGTEATVAARLTAAEGATTAAQATATAAVPKATYDAHTVLAATTDNTPAAVTVGEQTIVGRKTGGNITALTAAETKTLLAIGQSDVTNLTSDLSAKAPLASPTFTGVPAAPTAAVDTNTTQVATTAFTVAQIADDAVAKAAVGNLLTANQASVETDTTGWIANTNCAISRSTAQASYGAASLALTSSAAGTMLAQTHSAAYPAVTPGMTYTAMADVRAATTARSAGVLINWLDSGLAFISTSAPTYTANSTSAWTTYRMTAVAPATAAYASVYVGVIDTGAASEVHYVDKVSLHQGAGGQWALPGTPITNLGFYTDESVGRRLFQWDANNSRWQQTYGDTGWRTVTSLVDTSGWTNAPTALAVYVRRTLEQSSMIAQWNPGTGSCSGQGVLTLPSGFGPAAGIIAPGGAWHSSDAGAYVGGWYWEAGTTLNLISPATSVAARTITTLPCSAEWPTTLPGTASGSIPA